MTYLSAEYFHRFLTDIYPCSVPFTINVVHRKYKKRVGTYFHGPQKINIYDGGRNDNQCRETAIHEYAHHLHQTEKNMFTDDVRKTDRSHGAHFWEIYAFLMVSAYKKGLYVDDYLLPLLTK